MTIHGYIDSASNGLIDGWVFSPDAPNEPLEIEVLVDGRRIASGIADRFRQDLLEAGIGNGRHGFTLEVTAQVMRKNQLEVRETSTLTPIVGSPIIPMEAKAEPASLEERQAPDLIFDITDLVWHLDHFGQVTGIPRVVVEILRAIYDHCLYDFGKITFVNVDYHTHQFMEVSPDSLLAYLDRYMGDSKGMPKKEPGGRFKIEHSLHFKEFTSSNRDFSNTVLISLGSGSWGIPNFFILVNQLRRKGLRFIQLLHDIIPLAAPALAPPEMPDIFQQFIRKALRATSHFLSVSEHCAKDTREFAQSIGYRCPPITVIRNGGNTNFGLVGKSQFARPYALCVGTIEQRKNHIILAKAWQKLIAKYGDYAPDLVVVGKEGRGAKEFADFLKATNFLDGRIKILSGVSDSDLAALYRDCLFTAYASLYEGWGLPVSESLAFGKTCLCSNATALPEAGLEYCVYFDPGDENDAFRKAEQLIFDPELRKDFEQKIQENYLPLPWKDVAQSVLTAVCEQAECELQTPAPTLDFGEYIFWSVNQDEATDEFSLNSILAFGKGLLSSCKLKWENYTLGDEIIAEGGTGDRNKYGLPVEDGECLLEFRLPTEAAAPNAVAYIAIRAARPEGLQQLSILHGLILNQQTEIEGEIVLCLDLEEFSQEGLIRIRLESDLPFTLRSVLIEQASDVKRRLDTHFRIQELKAGS